MRPLVSMFSFGPIELIQFAVVVALWMFILGKLPFQRQKLCSRCRAQLQEADEADVQLQSIGKALKQRHSEASP